MRTNLKNKKLVNFQYVAVAVSQIRNDNQHEGHGVTELSSHFGRVLSKEVWQLIIRLAIHLILADSW